MVTATCQQSHTKAFNQAISHKATKYSPAVANSSITKVVPFVMLPFSILSRPAKAFLKCTMGNTTAAKQAKVRLHLTMAAIQGTAHLSYTWGTCTTLIISSN